MALPDHGCVNGWTLNEDDTVSRCLVCAPPKRHLEVAHARTTDPLPSHLAAASVKVSPSEDFVLMVMKDIGKAVLDEDLISFIRAQYPNATHSDSRLRTARRTLVDKGLVRFAGRGRTKRDGVATLYEVTPR